MTIRKMKKYNPIKRLLNKKKIESLENKLEELTANFMSYSSESRTNMSINDLNDKVLAIEDQKYRYVRATNASELGFSTSELISCIESDVNNLIALNKEDLDRFLNHDSSYSSLADCILVHKTNHMPSNNEIKTTKNSGGEGSEKVEISSLGLSETFNYEESRNTVHFAVNCEVASHGYGSWDNTKYAVLIPFAEVERNNLKNALEVDTYFEGNVKFTHNTIVLCPQDEVAKMRELNPTVKVQGYIGENVSECANTMIKILGYKNEVCGNWSWGDNHSSNNYRNLIASLGYPITPHYFTEDKETEESLANINICSEILKILVKSIKPNTNISDIMNEITSKDSNIMLFLDHISIMYRNNIIKYTTIFEENISQLNLYLDKNEINKLITELASGSQGHDREKIDSEVSKYILSSLLTQEQNKHNQDQNSIARE